MKLRKLKSNRRLKHLAKHRINKFARKIKFNSQKQQQWSIYSFGILNRVRIKLYIGCFPEHFYILSKTNFKKLKKEQIK